MNKLGPLAICGILGVTAGFPVAARATTQSAASATTTACEQFKPIRKDPPSAWFDHLRLDLCTSPDPDKVVLSYLMSADGDPALLERAQSLEPKTPATLWLIAVANRCDPFRHSCERQVAAARRLAELDPDNAVAWFTQARINDRSLEESDQVDPLLAHAVRAKRVHDYGFELTRSLLAATAKLTAEAVQPGSSIEQARVEIGVHVLLLTTTLNDTEWLKKDCIYEDLGSADETEHRKSACSAVQKVLVHSDSSGLTGTSGDAQGIEAAFRSLREASASRAGAAAILAAFRSASSESEMLKQVADATAKAH